MREAKAWQILAEEYDAHRTHSKFLCVNLQYADAGTYANATIAAIPHTVRDSMARRIEVALGGRSAAYGYFSCGENMTDQEQRDGRVLACLMFSEQAKEEAK